MRARVLAGLTTTLLLTACGSTPTAPSESAAAAALTPVASTADWPASSPEAEGLDSSRLGDLALRIRRGDYGRITSVLIARDGKLLRRDSSPNINRSPTSMTGSRPSRSGIS